MKKIALILVTNILLFLPLNVNANIICNDGTVSSTCIDCHQGCCSGHDGCTSNPNHYSSKKSYANNDEKNTDQNGNSFGQMLLILLILVVIFGPIIYGIVSFIISLIKEKLSIKKYTFEERYQMYKESINHLAKGIMSNKKSKSNIIYININNEVIKSLIIYNKKVASDLNGYGKVYYRTLYSVLNIKNLNVDERTFKVYEQKSNDIFLDIYCDIDDIIIYDYDKQIREYFNFTAKNLTLQNIKNSKKHCPKFLFKYVKLYLKNTNYHKNIVINIDIGQLKLLSEVCASIRIIEKSDESNYECSNCGNKKIHFLDYKCHECGFELDWSKDE